MTKKDVVEYALQIKDEIDEYKSKIKSLEEQVVEKSSELQKLMTIVEEKRKTINSISNEIQLNDRRIKNELSDLKDYIQNFGKGIPCAIEHEGKLIVVTDVSISVEENFIA